MYVSQVAADGAAGRSGELCVGDKVLSVDGRSLVGLTLADTLAALRASQASATVTLLVVHAPLVADLVLSRPSADARLGLQITDGDIVRVVPGGLAYIAGLRPGMRCISATDANHVAHTSVPAITALLHTFVGTLSIASMPRYAFDNLTATPMPV